MTSESFSLSLLSLFPLALLHLIDLKLCGVVPHHFPGQIKDSTSRGMFVLLCWAFKSYCQFYQFYSKILICGQAIFHLFQQHHLVLFFRWEKNQEKYKWSQKNYSSLMVIANNDEDLGGGGNSPDVLVVTTFHFLLAKDFYHKSDVFYQ